MKRLLTVTAVLVATALLMAACGGDSTTDGVASLDLETTVSGSDQPAPAEPTDEEALLAFTACMRDNGFDIDDPTVDAEGNVQLQPPDDIRDEDFDLAAAQEALENCEDLLGGVTLGFGRADDAEFEDSLLAWAGCMRDNGYHVDDPDFTAIGPGGGGDGQGGGPPGGGPFGNLDQDDPAFQTAMSACEDLLPGFGGVGAGGNNGG